MEFINYLKLIILFDQHNYYLNTNCIILQKLYGGINYKVLQTREYKAKCYLNFEPFCPFEIIKNTENGGNGKWKKSKEKNSQ